MKNAVSFGILFIPKSSKTRNGTAPLYARITVNGERIELSLKRRITFGTVWINQHGAIHPMVPFGGIKDSGYGREHGGFGVREFVNAKAVMCLNK